MTRRTLEVLVIALSAHGLSDAQIADLITGVNRQACYRIRRKYGLTDAPPRSSDAIDLASDSEVPA